MLLALVSSFQDMCFRLSRRLRPLIAEESEFALNAHRRSCKLVWSLAHYRVVQQE